MKRFSELRAQLNEQYSKSDYIDSDGFYKFNVGDEYWVGPDGKYFEILDISDNVYKFQVYNKDGSKFRRKRSFPVSKFSRVMLPEAKPKKLVKA